MCENQPEIVLLSEIVPEANLLKYNNNKKKTWDGIANRILIGITFLPI